MMPLSLSPFSFLTRTIQKAGPKVEGTARIDDAERREIFGELIAACACESEYGAQMLMSLYPRQF